MKKHSLLSACLACLLAIPALKAAAEPRENTIYTVVMGDISYTPKEDNSTKSTLLSVGKALLTGEASAQLDQYADDVRAAVAQGLADVRRLDMLDGGQQADFYVDGSITNITTVSKLINPTDTKKSSYTGYKAIVRVTVNLRSTADGTVFDSHTFTTSEYSFNDWFTAKETAVNRALTRISDDIDSYFEHAFPLYATLEEAGESKKDKQKEIYINIGSQIGVAKNNEFYVYAVKTIGTKEARQELGRIKVSEVMGDEVSRCKVTKGGDKIKAAIDAGTELLIVSK